MSRIGFYGLVLFLLAGGCDIVAPQQQFRLAVSDKNYFYSYVTTHLQPFLEQLGYGIELVGAENALDANRLVAEGKADLTFINNHSDFMATEMAGLSGQLRTVLPIAQRLLFVFTKVPVDSAHLDKLFQGKVIGLELVGGETHRHLESLFQSAKLKPADFVQYDQPCDLILFWGTLYGKRAARLMAEGWKPVSLPASWLNFISLNAAALSPYTLPAIPGEPDSRDLQTVSTTALLVAGNHLAENSIYELVNQIVQHRQELVAKDIMYRVIQPKLEVASLLYPLHEGTAAFLNRDEPTVLERYADTIALLISLIAILYGAIQTIRLRLRMREKERVDEYFHGFLLARSEGSVQGKVEALNGLLNRALDNMTKEKLEKNDFHMLATLVQQELAIAEYKRQSPVDSANLKVESAKKTHQ